MTCPHGFAKTSQCVECMLDGPVDNAWRKVGEPFASKYGQHCDDCGLVVAVGQLLQRWDRGDPPTATVYTHPEHTPKT